MTWLVSKLTQAWYHFRARCQRFRRGWAYSDVWSMDDWFIQTLEPMLRYLQAHHHGVPLGYTDEKWTQRLGRMADCLHLMDTGTVQEELFDGDLTKYNEIFDAADKNKTEFFELFAEDFYGLWD